MSYLDMRPPPCRHCGLVESARSTSPHRCNPTSVQAMQIGAHAVEQIGHAIRDAFALLAKERTDG